MESARKFFRWIQTCLDDKLPPLIEFEESLRNGVVLARLANFVAPKVVREKDIFDLDQSHYKVSLRYLLPLAGLNRRDVYG